MPYINKFRRNELPNFEDFCIETPGELNYLITLLIKNYIKENELNYQTINDVVGTLDCSKMEFYARVARPYEDEKIKQNGDVY
jgi:hypothetical protein